MATENTQRMNGWCYTCAVNGCTCSATDNSAIGLTEVTTDTAYTTDPNQQPVLVRGVPAQAANYCLVVHSLHLRGKVQMLVNFHFMLIYSPACSTCLFSWYGLLITVGGVGGDFSQTRQQSFVHSCYLLLVDVGLKSFTSFECPTRCRHRDAF